LTSLVWEHTGFPASPTLLGAPEAWNQGDLAGRTLEQLETELADVTDQITRIEEHMRPPDNRDEYPPRDAVDVGEVQCFAKV